MEQHSDNFLNHEIGDPHLNKIIKEGESYLETNKEILEDALQSVSDLLDMLKMEQDYFEHMNQSNETKEFLDILAEEEGFEKKSSTRGYSDEELKKVENNIKKITLEIKKIEGLITDTNLDSIWMDGYLQRFKDVQDRLKKIITTIYPNQVN